MIYVKIITTVLMLTYLWLQSVQDVKTKRVLVWPNNTAILLNFILYAVDCIRFGESFSLEIVAVILPICIACVLGFFGSGDAKAMVAVYFSLRYWATGYPHPNLDLFLYFMLISHAGLLIASVFKKKKEKHAAFFPFLTIGYASVVAYKIIF